MFRGAPAGFVFRVMPKSRMPVPASKMKRSSLGRRISRHDVFPPYPRFCARGVGVEPRTPQNRSFIRQEFIEQATPEHFGTGVGGPAPAVTASLRSRLGNEWS